MFKRILVPLDGSELAERAIPVAARLAHASEGVILLLRVVDIPIENRPGQTPEQAYGENAYEKGLDTALDYLESIAGLEELADIDIEAEALVGAVAPTILSCAQSLEADMIVVCSHGYTGFKRCAMGSVAQKVARQSPIPVLVLREDSILPAETQSGAEHSFTALVTLDDSIRAEAALEPAAQVIAALAAPAQAKLHLLEVVSIMPTYGRMRSQTAFDGEIREEEKQKAAAYLESTIKRLQETLRGNINITMTSSVVVETDIAEGILRAAEKPEHLTSVDVPTCDLIAMATHGRGGLPRWLLGSVTEKVMHTTKLPLLIVRPLGIEAKTIYKRAATTNNQSVKEGSVEVEVVNIEVPPWTGLL
ncbi:MAG TPA: universal stress protein [Ktedonobacteraceae bacterium]|nr:universal stress protein [Ktedonobacteraceae bacterium]